MALTIFKNFVILFLPALIMPLATCLPRNSDNDDLDMMFWKLLKQYDADNENWRETSDEYSESDESKDFMIYDDESDEDPTFIERSVIKDAGEMPYDVCEIAKSDYFMDDSKYTYSPSNLKNVTCVRSNIRNPLSYHGKDKEFCYITYSRHHKASREICPTKYMEVDIFKKHKHLRGDEKGWTKITQYMGVGCGCRIGIVNH